MTHQRQLINIGFRDVDADVWLAFKVHCAETGQKLGPAITEAMRREIRRMEAKDRSRGKRS